MFENDNAARLIVGSNNLTGAGLFVNTEAGLLLDAPITDPLIRDARSALSAWRDINTGFVKRLDQTLLDDLVTMGYVFPENALQTRRTDSRNRGNQARGTRQLLFRTQRFSAPPIRRATPVTAAVPGAVLLMRVRRASETVRRTQIQIPIRVVESNFFSNINALLSAHDARSHPLVRATARGSLNTIKTEIPEIDTMVDPVLRLERTNDGIVYQAFDANSVLGSPIRQALENGFRMSPPRSMSSIRNLERATWWRFI